MQINANRRPGQREGEGNERREANERWMNYGETVGISVIIHDSIRVTSVRKKVPAPSLTEVGTE